MKPMFLIILLLCILFPLCVTYKHYVQNKGRMREKGSIKSALRWLLILTKYRIQFFYIYLVIYWAFCCCCCYFSKGFICVLVCLFSNSHFVDQLASNLQRSRCPCLMNAGIKVLELKVTATQKSLFLNVFISHFSDLKTSVLPNTQLHLPQIVEIIFLAMRSLVILINKMSPSTCTKCYFWSSGEL